eukprot:2680738-Amphidinium_carterae.3
MAIVRGTLSVMNSAGVGRLYTSSTGGRLMGSWTFDDTTVTLSVKTWTRMESMPPASDLTNTAYSA